MRITLRLFVITLLSFGLNLAVIDAAEAKRFGGARSMGKQSGSLSSGSASKPQSPAQQQAFNKNQQARQQMSQRGGLMGMLGGLALGGLLGALLFGGAFENLNFMDLLVFGGLAYLLYRIFAARRQGGQPGRPAVEGAGLAAGNPAGDDLMTRGAADGARREPLQSWITPGSGGANGTGDAPPATQPGARPADFDEKAFLGGAVRAFELLQQSWNDGDLAEIRGLTTDEMFGELQDMTREAGADNFVQVLKVDAELIDVRELAGVQEAVVLFDAILREAQEERPTQVREMWHFTRESRARSPRWLLEGIEQMQA